MYVFSNSFYRVVVKVKIKKRKGPSHCYVISTQTYFSVNVTFGVTPLLSKPMKNQTNLQQSLNVFS